mmetsp:Transcript_80985/g.131229  ORF Transcript_80985/g.131229 Transcript_80985/m.131229 type:complete len:93 (-) Transcript_80985:1565-1843(-)
MYTDTPSLSACSAGRDSIDDGTSMSPQFIMSRRVNAVSAPIQAGSTSRFERSFSFSEWSAVSSQMTPAASVARNSMQWTCNDQGLQRRQLSH